MLVKDALVNIELLDNIDDIYTMVTITKPFTPVPKTNDFGDIAYLIEEKSMFHIAIHTLRLGVRLDVSIDEIYNTMYNLYKVAPYIIIKDGCNPLLTGERIQCDIIDLSFFVIKYYNEIHSDPYVTYKLSKAIYQCSKDIVPGEFDECMQPSTYVALIQEMKK